jgi:hypothetical protein
MPLIGMPCFLYFRLNHGNATHRIDCNGFAMGARMSLEVAGEHRHNPLEVVECMAADNNWPFASVAEAEIALVINGGRTNYQISFSWMEEIEVLHLACAFEMKVPQARLSEIQHLIVGINEQLWVGHFDVWTQNGMVMFRHALLLVGGVAVSVRQCEVALGSALDTCERYYPAFQFVVWAGKTAREAMDSVMIETLGQA